MTVASDTNDDASAHQKSMARWLSMIVDEDGDGRERAIRGLGELLACIDSMKRDIDEARTATKQMLDHWHNLEQPQLQAEVDRLRSEISAAEERKLERELQQRLRVEGNADNINEDGTDSTVDDMDDDAACEEIAFRNECALLLSERRQLEASLARSETDESKHDNSQHLKSPQALEHGIVSSRRTLVALLSLIIALLAMAIALKLHGDTVAMRAWTTPSRSTAVFMR